MNTNREAPEYLTVPQAAKRAGVSEDTIRRWFRERRLDRYRVGGGRGRVRVRTAQLDSLSVPRPDAPAVGATLR